MHYLSGIPKYTLGFVLTLLFRLVTPLVGLSNISPLMATQLTGSKAYGALLGGLYGAASFVLLDLLVGRIGSWTITTSITYGIVGVVGAWYLNNKEASAKNFVVASIVGTLFFDLITGVLMGPLFYDQSWSSAIIGQIPFTARHLVGNMTFAALLAPWFYRAIMSNPKWALNLSKQAQQ